MHFGETTHLWFLNQYAYKTIFSQRCLMLAYIFEKSSGTSSYFSIPHFESPPPIEEPIHHYDPFPLHTNTSFLIDIFHCDGTSEVSGIAAVMVKLPTPVSSSTSRIAAISPLHHLLSCLLVNPIYYCDK